MTTLLTDEQISQIYHTAFAETPFGGDELTAFGRAIEQAVLSQQGGGEAVAWMHPDGRVIPASTKSTAERDGGASASSIAGYTIALGPITRPAPAEPPKGDAWELLRGAESWIVAAPHSDNCFVSSQYDGDPGDKCNCGKDGLLTAISDALATPASSEPKGEAVKWISVQDALPPDDTPVLIYIDQQDYLPYAIDQWRMQREAPLAFSSETIETGYAWNDYEYEQVTHWMPLPPPPIEESSHE